MGQLMYDKLQTIKETIHTVVPEYDHVLLDTGAGISEVVLQFNLFAPRNVIVLNKEPTSMTDAYAVIKVMHQRFQTRTFGIVVNSVGDENEAQKLFDHMDGVCKNFLQLPLHYLGHIVRHDAIPQSVVNQRILVQEAPDSVVGRNCQTIAAAISNWKN
jgi:flagellar biosynthesis protein FlhG